MSVQYDHFAVALDDLLLLLPLTLPSYLGNIDGLTWSCYAIYEQSLLPAPNPWRAFFRTAFHKPCEIGVAHEKGAVWPLQSELVNQTDAGLSINLFPIVRHFGNVPRLEGNLGSQTAHQGGDQRNLKARHSQIVANLRQDALGQLAIV